MLLFPHESIRPSQEEFIKAVQTVAKNGGNLIVHAPTGLGKTAAALAPAITESLSSDITIFFLTSRHTQHEIAIKTLEEIKKRHGTTIPAVDIIGKKWMCLHSGVEKLPSGEFTEFCRNLREDGKCEYYSNLKKGETLQTKGKLVVEKLKNHSPVRNQMIIDEGRAHDVCPYYASIEVAKKAKVIIGDYYYVFHPKIREQFFQTTSNQLENSLIIVDEAHNLPDRIKNLATSKLSNLVLKRAISEAHKNNLDLIERKISHILSVFDAYAKKMRATNVDEMYLTQSEFTKNLSLLGPYDELIEEFENIGDTIRENNQVSYIGAVGSFLQEWEGKDEGFARIISLRKGLREELVTLSYRCLDPGIISGPVLSQSFASVLMSGTLQPTSMYRELLGIESATELNFPSPFPENNKLSLIVPQTSTKFTTRNDEMYQKMSTVLTKIVAKIPGNSAIFFPSYYLLEQVQKFFQTSTDKTVFMENREMNTTEKQEFIDRFREYKHSGAVLMGVISGNFGEGIDLPGDELKGVVIVGLPLGKPDLETEKLIKYYDEKFGKGWDYGYVFPAFNKTMQSAGRCIRSETDRGVIVYLDERYAWPQYKRCFPDDAHVKITLLYENVIEDFFDI